jgi:hypothetical protein
VCEHSLFGHFARHLTGKARAGTDSVLLKHRFSPDGGKSCRPDLPGGRNRWAENAVSRQILPGGPAKISTSPQCAGGREWRSVKEKGRHLHAAPSYARDNF